MGLLTDKEKGLLNEASLAEAKKAKIVYLDLDEIHEYSGNIGEPTEQEINYRMENIREEESIHMYIYCSKAIS